mgnify:FL=1
MRLIVVLLFLGCLLGASAKEHPEAKLPFMSYCQYFNYPVQQHIIETEDGYLLTYFRIQKKNTTIIPGLTPIFLQHGLLDSSDTWIINDEDKAPAFILANQGYDVWLGNSRGNKHSRKHIHYNPDKDAEFWQFTFQDMADFDIPAAFRYIYNVVKQKVNYIGHSQGTIQMHIALAKQNPAVEALMGKYFGFGPVVYVNHQESNIFTLLDKSYLLEWYHLRHIHEFMPSPGWFETDIGRLFCADFAKVCADILAQVMDSDPNVDNYERYDVLVGHAPAGTSVMNMEHWKQMVDTGEFKAYDWGSEKANMEHYNQKVPPM